MAVRVYLLYFSTFMSTITSPVSAQTPVPAPVSNRIDVLDYIRGLAIIHIILYHYFLEWFHGGFLIVPEGVMANVSRLEIFHDGGVLGFVKNAFGFLWAYGFFSVNLFLLLSGFVLTFSALKNEKKAVPSDVPATLTLMDRAKGLMLFYWKKMKRVIIPLYISIIIGIGFLYLRNVLFPQFAAAPIYGIMDILKLIFVPFFVYDIPFLQKFNGDLWFITLILQLYILFPLLYRGLKKLDIWKFLGVTFVLTVAYRYLATYALSTTPMGVIYPSENSYYLFSFFLPRLFEFTLGMALAYAYIRRNDVMERMVSFGGFLGGVALSLLGFAFDMYRWGWPYSDLTVAMGLFLVFLNLGSWVSRIEWTKRIMTFLSDSSYENFLIHHYYLNYFLSPLILVVGWQQESGFWLFMVPFVIGSVLLGWIAQKMASSIG